MQQWLDDPGRPGRTASSTARLYERIAIRWILDDEASPLTGLTVDDVHPHDVSLWLRRIALDSGIATARTARTVLSAVFTFAISQRFVMASPTRSASLAGVRGRPRDNGRPGPSHALDPKRAFTAAERDRVVEAARALDQERGEDLADLLVFVAGTGVRIGEGLALHWEDVDLSDPRRAWATVGGWTVARESGGMHRVAHGTNKRAVRRLALPAVAGQMLRERLIQRQDRLVVFGSPLQPSRYREVSSVSKRLRRLFDSVPGDDGRPMTWASSHTLRRTIVTQLHAAGMPSAMIADQTGHRDLRVLEEHYIARLPYSSAAADLLDQIDHDVT